MRPDGSNVLPMGGSSCADRVVNGEISSAAGGAQALIIQDCGQRLPCSVVQQGLGTFGVHGGGILRGGDMSPSLPKKPVGVFSACRHALKAASGNHLLNDDPALHPPHASRAASWPRSSSTRGFDLTEVRNGSEVRSRSQMKGVFAGC